MKIFISPKYEIKYNTINYVYESKLINYFKKFSDKIELINNENFNHKLSHRKNKSIVILSGGNDLYKFNKKKVNLHRKIFEEKLIKFCIKNKIKLIGICKGFQQIGDIYKFKFDKSKNHVKKNHVIFSYGEKLKKINVNSFHNYVIKKTNKDFKDLFYSKDGNIEISFNQKDSILGLMFHPERKNIDQKKVDRLLKSYLNK